MPHKGKQLRPADRSSLRADIYARVSTSNQVEGSSLEAQVEQCTEYISAHRWVVAGPPHIDRGVSGASESRPQLDAMLARARAGEIDAIVVAKLDRLGRTLLHLLELMQEMDQLGVRIVSVGDGVDTSSTFGRLLLQLLGIFAEFERNRIRERSVDGVRRRVEQGGFVGSVPPYGYRAVADPSGRGVVLDIDESAAACIQAMYRLLVEDQVGVARATAVLNGLGHTSASGAPWTPETLARWARGEAPLTAAGIWRWNDLVVQIPPIITQAQSTSWSAWVAATRVPQTSHGAYLLSGHVITPCGRKYHGRTAGKQAPVYACRNHYSPGADGDCGCVNIRVDAMDAFVWGEVVRLVTTPEGLRAVAMQATKGGIDIGAETLDDRIAEATESIGALSQQLADEYNGAKQDGFDAETARRMVEPVRAQLDASKADLARLQRSQAALQRSAVGDTKLLRDAVEKAGERFGELDRDGKRDVLAALAVEVEVTGYETCSACGGTGYGSLPPGSGRRSPMLCGQCRKMRRLPVLEVRITAPEALLGIFESLDVVAVAG